jgi:dCTP deaminase
MILSDRDIKKAIATGRVKITPKPDFKTQLGSCSIDLRLGNEVRVFRPSKITHVDVRNMQEAEKIMENRVIPKGEPLVIHPGDLVLATTLEWLEISNDLIGRIEGRSSLGRLGVIVHGTASIFDAGWKGKPVMELGNLGVVPVILWPGMRVCAFTFEELSSPAEVPYTEKKANKYARQAKPLSSKFSEEVENKKRRKKK